MKIWKSEISLDLINKRSENSLSDHLGIVYTEIGDDYLKATMPVDARTLQPFGVLHGGSNCVLAESVGSAAANFCIDNTKYVAVGLDINVNHLRPVKVGSVTGIATPYHLGKSTQVWEIKIFHADKLSSVSRLTLAIVPHKQP